MEEQANVMSDLMSRFKINGGTAAMAAAPMAPTAPAPRAEAKSTGKESRSIKVRMPPAARRSQEQGFAQDDELSMPAPAARVNGKVNGSSAEEWQEF